jgi:hypothetical protein
MRLTRQDDYAVRVMIDLAAHVGDRPVRRTLIQARQDGCYPLERLFRDVRTATMTPPNEDRAIEIIGKAMLGVRDDTRLARHAG